MKFEQYEIPVTERRGCKRIILHCKSGSGELSMSVPPRTTQKAIRAFLEAHRDWIDAHAKPIPTWQPAFAPGERHWVLGIPVKLGTGGVPAGEAAFRRYQAQQLTQLLNRLLPAWSRRVGAVPSAVKLRDMRSRWGSCQTVKRSITFSLRLGAMPPECVEYVVVHELCHLHHPNHSADFWAEVARHLPDWKARRDRLNHFDVMPLPPAP